MIHYLEHAEDVLAKWLEWRVSAKVAIVIVTRTEGGAVRDPGAMMVVSQTGERAGYISGGCIDSDVAIQAQDALVTGKIKYMRYGKNSPFVDLPLPCGGTIELMILPDENPKVIEFYCAFLLNRKPIMIHLSSNGFINPDAYDNDSFFAAISAYRKNGGLFSFYLIPKLKLRIAGKGADSIAIAKLAQTMGIPVHAQLIDLHDIEEAKKNGIGQISNLTTNNHSMLYGDMAHDIGQEIDSDDAWTAFLLAFHDVEWEKSLLMKAISGPAFYIGAVGSHRAQAKRKQELIGLGVSKCQAERVLGPVGLIPSMRNASMLAISILAEIVETYHGRIKDMRNMLNVVAG